jgi:hypothetical protein
VTDRPTHLHRSTGSAVFPEGYDETDIELLPEGFWEAHDFAAALSELRAKRDKLLQETDAFLWVEDHSLYPKTEGQRQAWLSYRQSLRDLPQSTNPLNPEWPNKPY